MNIFPRCWTVKCLNREWTEDRQELRSLCQTVPALQEGARSHYPYWQTIFQWLLPDRTYQGCLFLLPGLILALIADLGWVVLFLIREQLFCSHRYKWTELKGEKRPPCFGTTSPVDPGVKTPQGNSVAKTKQIFANSTAILWQQASNKLLTWIDVIVLPFISILLFIPPWWCHFISSVIPMK